MVTIHLMGHVTDEGELIFDPPKNLPPGEVEITIQVGEHQFTTRGTTSSSPEQDFTDEEIKELLTFKPKTAQEIVENGIIGGWEDMGITDSVEWVEEQRRKRRERNRW